MNCGVYCSKIASHIFTLGSYFCTKVAEYIYTIGSYYCTKDKYKFTVCIATTVLKQLNKYVLYFTKVAEYMYCR